MPKAIEQISDLTVGHVRLGYRGGVSGSVRHQAHDGDTIMVRAIGDFGVRFLGVDAAEMSYPIPGAKKYVQLSDSRWEAFLSNPFDDKLPAFDPPLSPGLRKYLRARVGPGTAANHFRHAVAAEEALEREVARDLKVLGQPEEQFQFFLVFSYEVMDRYGRFLCFVNRNQFHPTVPEPRPASYNERLLQEAKVSPFFLWPNINPFRKIGSLVKAVIPPGKANDIAEGDETLSAIRQSLRNAREKKIGIFDGTDPLRLLPFELRYLARRYPPDRWVIDLGKNNNVLIAPQKYYTVPNMEDRLYLPEEFVPLFMKAGWKRQD